MCTLAGPDTIVILKKLWCLPNWWHHFEKKIIFLEAYFCLEKGFEWSNNKNGISYGLMDITYSLTYTQYGLLRRQWIHPIEDWVSFCVPICELLSLVHVDCFIGGCKEPSSARYS